MVDQRHLNAVKTPCLLAFQIGLDLTLKYDQDVGPFTEVSGIISQIRLKGFIVSIHGGVDGFIKYQQMPGRTDRRSAYDAIGFQNDDRCAFLRSPGSSGETSAASAYHDDVSRFFSRHFVHVRFYLNRLHGLCVQTGLPSGHLNRCDQRILSDRRAGKAVNRQGLVFYNHLGNFCQRFICNANGFRLLCHLYIGDSSIVHCNCDCHFTVLALGFARVGFGYGGQRARQHQGQRQQYAQCFLHRVLPPFCLTAFDVLG